MASKRLKSIFQIDFLGVINHGAYGTVYAVKEKNSNVLRALKVLTWCEEDTSIEDFLRTAIQEIVFGSILLGDTFKGFTLEFNSDKELLACSLQRYARCTLPSLWPLHTMQIRFLFRPLCIQLAQFHKYGILHRDIKPDNILVLFDNQLVLCDTSLSIRGSVCTNPNCVTLWYRAPEVLLKQSYCHAIDVWSLGITMLDTYLGKSSYKNTTNVSEALQRTGELFGVLPSDPETYRSKFLKESPRSFKDLTPDKSFNDLLDQMLCIDDEKRITMEGVLKHPFWTGETTNIALDTSKELNLKKLPEQVPNVRFIHAQDNNEEYFPVPKYKVLSKRVESLVTFLKLAKKFKYDIRTVITAYFLWDHQTFSDSFESVIIYIACFFVATAVDAEYIKARILQYCDFFHVTFSHELLVEVTRCINMLLQAMRCSVPDTLLYSTVFLPDLRIFLLAADTCVWNQSVSTLENFFLYTGKVSSSFSSFSSSGAHSKLEIEHFEELQTKLKYVLETKEFLEYIE